jgi:hypothetical protein
MSKKPREEDYNRDLAMMQTPEDWPIWPILPLKRRNKTGNWPELGYLLEDMGKDRVYFIKGMMPIGGPPDMWGAVKADFHQLIDDGWVVD